MFGQFLEDPVGRDTRHMDQIVRGVFRFRRSSVPNRPGGTLSTKGLSGPDDNRTGTLIRTQSRPQSPVPSLQP